MPTYRAHHLVAVGLVVAVVLAGTSGAASAPARGEGSSVPPPVGRIARELADGGAQRVIVFASVRGKSYVATAGTRRPSANQRFRIGSVGKTFTATIVLQLVDDGKLRLSDTLETTCPASYRGATRSRSASCSSTARDLWSTRTTPTCCRGSKGQAGRRRPGRSTSCASRDRGHCPSLLAPCGATRTRTTSRSVS